MWRSRSESQEFGKSGSKAGDIVPGPGSVVL